MSDWLFPNPCLHGAIELLLSHKPSSLSPTDWLTDLPEAEHFMQRPTLAAAFAKHIANSPFLEPEGHTDGCYKMAMQKPASSPSWVPRPSIQASPSTWDEVRSPNLIPQRPSGPSLKVKPELALSYIIPRAQGQYPASTMGLPYSRIRVWRMNKQSKAGYAELWSKAMGAKEEAEQICSAPRS